MAQLVSEPEEEVWAFFCPGCQCSHSIRIKGPQPRWAWNGDTECPTISPSILAVGEYRCHSFVRDGSIQYLTDCTHALAGQTLYYLPDWEEI